MADSRLYVHVLLDRSGSMEACRDKTIDAFNEYVNSLKVQSKAGTRLSLTTFDSESIDAVIDACRINDVPKLTRETFVPRGMTPLFDATAQVVSRIDKVTLVPDERVAFAILTDGNENASREMTADSVRKLLVDRQERCNWLVQYLGANQDAWAVGQQFGAAVGNTMTFDTTNAGFALDISGAATRRYAASRDAQLGRDDSRFTAAERARARKLRN